MNKFAGSEMVRFMNLLLLRDLLLHGTVMRDVFDVFRLAKDV